ncbi:hypothetical protein AYO49_05070 [Verrucomicrobiaceae bacterium SCGC AG-212-N21]|nr:hypothetical protein AYO49_05070 [Verrucomicrobiaceae bacterium SCGC AG-212-N21]
MAWPSTDAPANVVTLTVAQPAPPEPLVIQQVNDEQLLTLLQDTPAAIMVWPDGRRTLLVLDQ